MIVFELDWCQRTILIQLPLIGRTCSTLSKDALSRRG